MNKKAIITILLALIAMAGQAHALGQNGGGKMLWPNALVRRIGRVCCILYCDCITMVMIIVISRLQI